jgi:hypothetical protein
VHIAAKPALKATSPAKVAATTVATATAKKAHYRKTAHGISGAVFSWGRLDPQFCGG